MNPQEQPNNQAYPAGPQQFSAPAQGVPPPPPPPSTAVPPPPTPPAPQQMPSQMTQQPAQPAGPAGPVQPQGPPPPPPAKPNSTQNALLIAEIRDGIAIMNDGSFRSVIMSQSINFDLMSPEEREAVEYSYQSFLNSLYFPVQIFIRSRKVDMRPYLEKMGKLRREQDNMLLGLLMDDYIEFIDILAQETNIMDKQFYVAIPFYPDIMGQAALQSSKQLFSGLFKKNTQKIVSINESELEKAKQELRNRVQVVMTGLNQIGVQSIPLDTEELIELYYDSYNPDTATRQQIKNYRNLTAPVIEKGIGQAPNPNLDRGAP